MPVGSDHVLFDAVRRRLRRPAGWWGLVLHLSRLPSPGPRPHHSRIARSLLRDTAQWHAGEVFTLSCGDLVLLCRTGDEDGVADAEMAQPGIVPPARLAGVLRQLLRADAPAVADLVGTFQLDDASQAEALLRYAQDRVADAQATAVEPAPATGATGRESAILSSGVSPSAHASAVLGDMAAAIDRAALLDLAGRQTAVLLADGELRPLFHEVAVADATLDSSTFYAGESDPYLRRHCAERLEARLLAAIADIDVDPSIPLHVGLGVTAVSSAAFAIAAGPLRGRLGITLSVMDACADPAALAAAREAMIRAGVTFVLGGLSALTLRLADVGALTPDLVKLDWSAALAADVAEIRAAFGRLLRAVGPDRVVLHHADGEPALHWGRRHGIRRFQGRYVEAMLAASRLAACRHAGACTLGQCLGRAAAVAGSGRALCRNHALLARAHPGPDAAGANAAGPNAANPYAASTGAAIASDPPVRRAA